MAITHLPAYHTTDRWSQSVFPRSWFLYSFACHIHPVLEILWCIIKLTSLHFLCALSCVRVCLTELLFHWLHIKTFLKTEILGWLLVVWATAISNGRYLQPSLTSSDTWNLSTCRTLIIRTATAGRTLLRWRPTTGLTMPKVICTWTFCPSFKAGIGDLPPKVPGEGCLYMIHPFLESVGWWRGREKDLGQYESETVVGSVGRWLCLVLYLYGILVTAFIEHKYL